MQVGHGVLHKGPKVDAPIVGRQSKLHHGTGRDAGARADGMDHIGRAGITWTSNYRMTAYRLVRRARRTVSSSRRRTGKDTDGSRTHALCRREARDGSLREVRGRLQPEHRAGSGPGAAREPYRGRGGHRRCRRGAKGVGGAEPAEAGAGAHEIPDPGAGRYGIACGAAVQRARQDHPRRQGRHPARARGDRIRQPASRICSRANTPRARAPASTCTPCASRSAWSRASPRSTFRP